MSNEGNVLEQATNEIKIGQSIADYQVIQRIENSNVYLVLKKQNQQTFAMKIFSPDPYACNHDAIVERLMNICQLDHENIVRVYETGEHEGFIYAVMEYIPGENLYNLMQRNPRLHWAAAAELAKDIIRGLVAAHSKGVVHRCLHPDRVLLGKGGQIKINFCNEGEITPSREVVNFVAPELFLGQDLDECSDVYSLGSIIYTIVTGKPPLAGKNPKEIALKHREMEPVLPVYGVADIPHSLSLIIDRTLSKDLKQRYQYSYELQAAIHNFLLNDIGTYKIGSYKELLPKVVEDTISIKLPKPPPLSPEPVPEPVPVQIPIEKTPQKISHEKDGLAAFKAEWQKFQKTVFPLSPFYGKILAGCCLSLIANIILLILLQ